MNDEPNYSVRLTVHVNASDPSEAARKFGEHVMQLGLAAQTYNVRDMANDQTFYADFDSFAPTVDVLRNIQRQEQGTWFIEPAGWVGPTFGPYLDELEASEAMDELGLSDESYKLVNRMPTLENVADQEAFEDGLDNELDDELTPSVADLPGIVIPLDEPVEKPKLAVGTCTRCKEEGKMLIDGLCTECEQDIAGAPRE